ncbi:phosphocholine-specific phospholipase C [Flexivirga meconopsidis]|uniref:phosphocholine-specific phospholipase C n=1 Tax=Flexivirga meconopsidis TaxID=2977121 RepID=UPI00223EC5B9
MPDLDRRRFLQIAGATAAATALTQSVARAAAIPAYRGSGSLADVEHVVILMQENRSFDHYFGTLRGVRGFDDPRAALLPSGRPVWEQQDAAGVVVPFRPDVDNYGTKFLEGLDHSWNGGHDAFAGGRYDRWVQAKSGVTMTHMRRGDMPFHYALADAFTICDAYHCSLMGPTDPNRYYMWTGWVGNDGKGGGPVIDNAEAGYGWKTYPERLESAGVSWKVYQDIGTGLDAAGSWGWVDDAYIGNYGDNSLLYFDAYRNAAPGSPLFEKARTGTNAKAGEGYFDQLRADVQGGKLPQVSWIAAPEAFSEHPNWPVQYGEWYVSQVLDALTSDPEVWRRTALFITYDENDGYFDHVVPPYANVSGLQGDSTVSTQFEGYPGGNGQPAPYGLGQRVPMLVVSPWSVGGWVCSETFDHTSIIRFLERRFGVHEPQISPWRRAVCGDLTAAFDFSGTGTAKSLPAQTKPDDDSRHPSYVPPTPRGGTVPRQESGTRPSRPLGYRLAVDAQRVGDRLHATFRNDGTLGAHFQVRSNDVAGAPFSYTVEAGRELTASWPVAASYDVQVHGPGGFWQRLTGGSGSEPQVQVRQEGNGVGRLIVQVTGPAERALTVRVRDNYGHTKDVRRHTPAGKRTQVVTSTGSTQGWYDLTITVDGDDTWGRQVAGRVETGRASVSDPKIGA